MNYEEFYSAHYRTSVDEVRFTAPMLIGVRRTTRYSNATRQLVERGATLLGQSRVQLADGRIQLKKRVLGVRSKDWAAFVQALKAWPLELCPNKENKEKPLTLEQRVERLEKLLCV